MIEINPDEGDLLANHRGVRKTAAIDRKCVEQENSQFPEMARSDRFPAQKDNTRESLQLVQRFPSLPVLCTTLERQKTSIKKPAILLSSRDLCSL